MVSRATPAGYSAPCMFSFEGLPGLERPDKHSLWFSRLSISVRLTIPSLLETNRPSGARRLKSVSQSVS